MKTILVLTDFSKSSKHAAEYAVYIALNIKAKVVLYNSYYVPQVAPVESGMYQAYYADYQVYAEESMARLKVEASALKSKFELIGIKELPEIECKNDLGVIGDNISQASGMDSIWMIVMGDKHNESFMSRFVFGSDSKHIIAHAKSPLLIVPQEASLKPFKRIVFAYPLLEAENLKCIEFLVELGSSFNSDIEVVHVFDEAKWKIEQQYLDYFNSVKNNIEYDKLNYHKIKEDDVPGAIEHFAEAIDSSLIAMIYRKYPFFEQIFHKSTVDKVIGYHKFPLLIFPDAYVYDESN